MNHSTRLHALCGALMLVCASSSAWATGSVTVSATTYIENGLADLDKAAPNLASAQTAFQNAVKKEPANPTANLFLALTDLAQLNANPATQTLLTQLGVPAAGRNIFHWTAKLKNKFPSGTSGDIEKVAAKQVLTALQTADGLLAVTGSAGSSYVAPPLSVTGLREVTIDYGDVIFLRALIHSLSCGILLWDSCDTNFKFGNIEAWLPTNALTLQQLLTKYPDLLNPASTAPADLLKAPGEFEQAVELSGTALNFLENRTPAATGRLFALDPDSNRDNEAEAMLAKATVVCQSLISKSQESYPISTGSSVPIDPYAFFSGSAVNLRGLLPVASHGAAGGSGLLYDHLAQGAFFPDYTFAGVLPGMTSGTASVNNFANLAGNWLDRKFHHSDYLPLIDGIAYPTKNLVLTGTGPGDGSDLAWDTDWGCPVVTCLATLTVSGTAQDKCLRLGAPNTGIASVVVVDQWGYSYQAQLNGTGTNAVPWTVSGIAEYPGVNTLTVYAYDNEGQASKPSTVQYTVKEYEPFNLQVTGSGSVTGPYAQGALVAIGTKFSLTAKPAAGCILEGWTIDHNDSTGWNQWEDSEASKQLQFAALPTTWNGYYSSSAHYFTGSGVITASFIPNPFVGNANRSFSQILYSYWNTDANGNPLPEGMITISLTPAGAFTGSVSYLGVTYPIKGNLAVTDYVNGYLNSTNITIARPGMQPLYLSLCLDISYEPYAVSGEIDDYQNGDYLGFGIPTNNDTISDVAGSYTVSLAPDPNAIGTIPGEILGAGFLTPSPTSTPNQYHVAGALPDGSSFSVNATLQYALDPVAYSLYSSLQLYIPIDNKGHTLVGSFYFNDSNYTDDQGNTVDVAGELYWTHPANNHASAFQSAFAGNIAAGGWMFSPPARNTAIDPFGSGAELVISNNSGSLLDVLFNVSSANKVAIAGGNSQNAKVTLTGSTGAFTGTYQDTSTTPSVKRTFSGVILQGDPNTGAGPYIGEGFSLGTDTSVSPSVPDSAALLITPTAAEQAKKK